MAAYAALASLSQTTNMIINKHNSLFSMDVERKIRSIHEYVTFLLSLLEDFPEKSKRWEGKMRDVAHDAEDIIEQYMWQNSYNGSIKPSGLRFEDQLVNVMVKFCLVAGEMMEERPAYLPTVSVSPSSSSSSSSSSRVASTGNGVVVGLDNDLMAIKDRLCGLSSELQVLPIVGMGGIGKTTLARNVYDDPLIMRHFYIRAWITISQDYSARRTLLCLLDSMKLNEERMSGVEIDDSTMAERVYKNLKGRRYLIVMDDVWSTKVWDDVRNVLPDDGNGSRIMLTTRLADLAAYPGSSSPSHKMQLMNDSQSWDLLRGKLFANNNCPLELEDIGKDIARSCVGLPLAAVLVAGLLSAVDKTLSSWKEIAKNANPIVGHETGGILSLSYTHLPHHLRPCFLFLGVYPEDENISASALTRLWVAEGFLKHENGCSKSLEEEAGEYLEDLVKRNLVIVTNRKSNGKIKRCSLHDMVRDLCIRMANQEKFLRVMDGRVNVPRGIIDERRVSFRFPDDVGKVWGPTIRTILCFQIKNLTISPAFLRCLRLLRVFDAIGENSVELPPQIFELFHLRYLVLVCYASVSSAISTLTNLQTLIIFQTSFKLGFSFKWKRYSVVDKPVSPLSLPLEIWGISELRHLIIPHFCMLPNPPADGLDPPLENLQTLFYIRNLVWNEKILQMIPNVKRVGLVYETNEEFRLNLVKHLHQLEKLEVYGFGSFSWLRRNPAFPASLKKLSFVGGGFPWDDMSIIGSLPNLQVLKLRNHACSGETWETADGEFPQLRFLLIKESQLEHWISESSHFPRLRCLVLRSCSRLKEIPEGIGEIPTLELIDVDCRNDSLVRSAEKINEDQQSYGNYSLHVHISLFNVYEISLARVPWYLQPPKTKRYNGLWPEHG